MAIRIVRNEQGNCINFFGSSNPTYWNACLSAEVDSVDTNSVNVINDIITSQTGTTQYEFFRIPYTEFVDAEGNGFASAQETADYITEKANVIGLGGGGTDLTGQEVCFKLDDTSTSIMLDNGFSFGVNTIHAVADGGTIKIDSVLGDITHFTGLEVGLACGNDGNVIAGGINDVVNYLNELFSVGAFEAVVITDPEATTIADVGGVDATMSIVGTQGVDPIGDDVFTASASGNYNGYISDDTIDQAGEYFTFDIRNEGQIGFGLVHSQASYDAGHWSGSSAYADPTSFGVGNSAHYGFQFSHWFHPTPNGSWTNYGANTAYNMGPAWYSANTHFEARDEWLNGDPIKIQVGISTDGFITISSLADDGITWKLHARTSYPVVDGAEFRLGIKVANSTPRVATLPKVHLLPEVAPTMTFRYIESPDGVFHYPVFSTSDEADYYDENHDGTTGTGTHSTIVFPDDPTYGTWYIPTTGYENNGSAAPTTGTFAGQQIVWNEITSLVNADLAPQAFDLPDMNVNELASVNIQVAPADSSYTTTVSGLPTGLTLVSHHIEGTAPEVTGDNVSNPSDSYTITVTRANSYGSVTDTFDIIVANLTAPVTAISGFNHVAGTTAMIDSDTMDDGSVVHVNNTVADGERFVIEKAYVETNILPALQGSGDMYIIGLENTSSDFSTLELSDFDAAIVWEWESSSSHTFKFYRDGSVVQNIVVGSLTQAFYDYAIEVDGTSAWLIACNLNSIMNEPSPSNGGSFSNTYEVTNIEDTAPVQIHMATLGTSGDISTTDIETITTPSPSAGSLTSFDHAIDFSGGEYAKHVNNSMFYQPLQMAGLANTVAGHSTQGYTSGNSSSRPWATVVIFKSDGYSGNQMIWNQGEGSVSGDDNIFVNVTANGTVNFGWGREGVGYNQCQILTNISSSTWYAVYVAHSGERLGGNNATAANLADCFDIRTMSSADSFASLSSNLSVTANWVVTGYRMDRTVAGDFTVGGRGTGYSYRGKVASMITHCLEANKAMPDATEIELMITDPLKWEADYLIGNSYRRPFYSNSSTNYQKQTSLGFKANQMWLMGDGTPDAFPNINNEQRPNWLNYTYLVMTGMVSSDIENVNINGLT